MKINVLPPEVIDQIAAGEVVERPCHLIKELVENSIDAGATEVIVDFSLGGRFVKIIDNGSGISKADLPKAFLRFATSKIKTSEDIWRLSSFGFRGEALASISSVSQMTLFSSDNDSGVGYRLVSQFGKLGAIEEVSRSRGTTVIVEELFQNVPARLKFMKSESAEAIQIKQIFKSIAIAHPFVNFRLMQDNKLFMLYAQKQNIIERLEEVLGVKHLFEGTAVRGSVKAHSFFASPDEVQKTSKMIWIYAQGRPIQDKSVQAAVMEAYRNLLMHGEFPVACVFIDVPADQVDVNIHPTKSQVKFLNPQDVFRAVQASIRTVLETAPWLENKVFHKSQSAQILSSTLTSTPSPTVVTQAPTSLFEKNSNPVVSSYLYSNESATNDLKLKSNETHSKIHSIVSDFEHGLQLSQAQNRIMNDPDLNRNQYKKKIDPAIGSLNFSANDKILEISDFEKSNFATEKKYWSQLDVIGQAGLTYIVCQTDKGILLVDQHAAHERVVFEKIMKQMKNKQIEVQRFLIPLTLDVSEEKIEVLKQNQSALKDLGIEIEELGPTTLAVNCAPAYLKDVVLVRELDRFAQQVIDYGVGSQFEKVITDMCASMACHSVVRAGQSLSVYEMKKLLVEMDEFPLSCYCPHGRPVSIEWSWTKIEKDFGRIV